MINDRIDKLEAKVRSAQNIHEETRNELLGLLESLKTEIEKLSETHEEDAKSIARFADISTLEATRAERKPQLVDAALSGLNSSIETFETTHPSLTQIVNRLAVVLSNVGI